MWKLKSTENFLKSLLKNRQDVIAADFGNFYSENATEELLDYALKNENGFFLKQSFRRKIFPSTMLTQKKNIEKLLD